VTSAIAASGILSAAVRFGNLDISSPILKSSCLV
jgi:hypothetical protein